MWAREGERDSRKSGLTLGLWPESPDAITGGEKTGRSVFGGGRDQELGLGREVSEAVHIFKQRGQVGEGDRRLPPGAEFGSSRWELGRSQHRDDLHPQVGRGHLGMTVAGKAAATLRSEAGGLHRAAHRRRKRN